VKPQRFVRRGGIETRDLDEETFLITRRTIEHLNPTAACIWRALEQPRGRQELYAAFRAAYPSIPHQRLNADLNSLLRALERKQLIRRF
jgi:Coenzyme PQQ synthesis protein D (PqqD)